MFSRLHRCGLLAAHARVAGLLALSASALAQGPVVNAPVAPDTIYVGRIGGTSGLSVIDLNGFGQSTGDPTYDPTYQTFHEGWTNYPNNPNFRYQANLMRPALSAGTTTLDGGSAGVFTLTKNSALQDLLVRDPVVLSVGDMMLGQPLDRVYNDGPAPFGCQLGHGNLCAFNGKMLVDVAFTGGHTLQPTMFGGTSLNSVQAGGNSISFAPSPNPPPLIFPQLCVAPSIGGQEPTSIDTPLTNLLVPGDPFGDPNAGIPPSGLLCTEQNAFFVGPSIEQQVLGACNDYQIRQQIGHFLYVIDRVRHEVVVFNSNSFTVITRITVPDPTELAMSPTLRVLAVSNRAADSVSFIDIEPTSATFHSVVQTTQVGHLPSGIAWEPDDEDVLVCNEGSNSVSIISASTGAVRKTVHRGLEGPFAIAITPRQGNFGFLRNVYFAYILDRAGRVSLFESGPDTVNGWGFDDIIGRTGFAFTNAKAIQPDLSRLTSGVWIVHEGQLDAHGQPTGLGGGAASNLVLDSTTIGQIPLNFNDHPNLRGLSFRIERSVGSDQLTGLPLDLAFDDQKNLGALAPYNSKNLVRNVAGVVHATSTPRYMFLPVRDPATGTSTRIDVIDLGSGLRVDTNAFHTGVQSIPARGAAVVMSYFRQ